MSDSFERRDLSATNGDNAGVIGLARPSAARSGRDRGSVGARLGMAEEGADLIGGFERQDVLELAGLLFDLRLAVESEAVGEQAFGQAMSADDVGGTLAPASSEFHDHAAVADGDAVGLKSIVTGIDEGLVLMRLGRMRRSGQ